VKNNTKKQIFTMRLTTTTRTTTKTTINGVLLLLIASTADLSSFMEVSAWTGIVSSSRKRLNWQSSSTLFVSSQHLEETVSTPSTTTTTTVNPTTDRSVVPYVVARGDGSTGGGGVPMPHVSNEDDMSLRRPKVNAEMPVG
jgi:hypothetical protein